MTRAIPFWLLLLALWCAGVAVVLTAWAASYPATHLDRPAAVRAAIWLGSLPDRTAAAVRRLESGSSHWATVQTRFRQEPDLKRSSFRDDGYLLLSGFDARVNHFVVRLIRLSDGKEMRRWDPDVAEIGKLITAATRSNPFFNNANYGGDGLKLGHALPTEDGGLIFANQGPLVRITACSRVRWVLNGVFHHSIERDGDGNIWTAYTPPRSAFDPRAFPGFRDDSIARISPDGKRLKTWSVAALLAESGDRGLVFGAGPYDPDAIHLNDADPALSTTPDWERGDVLISMKHRSAVGLFRPSESRLLWLKVGPWLGQHDPSFLSNGRILVFGNDIVTFAAAPGESRLIDERLVARHNDAYIYDPRTRRVSVPFTRAFDRLNVATPSEGRLAMLPNGDLFVEETAYGRVLRMTQAGIPRWTYINHAEVGRVGMLGWSRYLSADMAKPALAIRRSCTTR